MHHYIADCFNNIDDIFDHEEVKRCLTSLFRRVDSYLYGQRGTSGSTCSIVLIIGKRVYQVNLGDSGSIIINGEGKVVSRTKDHNPEDEIDRINSVGGTVKKDMSVYRVNGDLATSRSFGDFHLKLIGGKYSPEGPVSSIPEIYSTDVNGGSVFVLGTDGLYDGMTDNEIIDILKTEKLSTSSKRLREIASKNNGSDDITVIVGLV